MSDRIAPEWFQSAPHWYYTHIERGLPSVITVRRATRDEEVSEQAPGTLVLRLRPRRGITLIFDIEGHDGGNIQREGARRYILRRNDTAIWKLTVPRPRSTTRTARSPASETRGYPDPAVRSARRHRGIEQAQLNRMPPDG
jgi:hypothetical protein